jgi:hypothetical protein
MIDVPIPFPTGSNPGKSRAETGGRIVNGFVEPLAEDAENPFVIRRAPGLKAFGDSGQTGYRGAMLAGPAVYAAFAGELVKFDDEGVVTALGNLDGTEPVSFARNNKLPTFQAVAVTEQGAFTVNATTGAASLVDADLPQPTDVCWGDGYFFFPIADGRCFASGINATTVSALDFTSADTDPDELMRATFYNSRLLLWGPNSIEVFSNVASPTAFPFRREAVIKGPGLGAKWGIAGHESGFNKGIFYLGSDNAIHTLNGYASERLSTPDIDRRIEATDKTTIRASCYITGGHAFVEFSCPVWTWTLDLTTQKWTEGRSYLQQSRRILGNSIFAFGKWLNGDRLSGKLIEPDTDVHYDLDQPLVVEVWSGKCKTFPYGMRVTRADFDFVKGVGKDDGQDPIERDPSVEISWSDDGGNVFSNPVVRRLGRQGKRRQKITVNGCGVTGHEGRIWKIRMSDPREFGLLGGAMAVLQQGR